MSTPKEKKPTAPKKKRKIVDLYIYKKRNSGTSYMSNEMPKFDPQKGLDSDGSEADICTYGLSTFGISPSDIEEFGRVIKVQVEILAIDQTDHKFIVQQTDFAPATLARSEDDFEKIRERRLRERQRTEERAAAQEKRRLERMNQINNDDSDEEESDGEDDG